MEAQTQTHQVKWKASLSNGETLYEEKGDYLRLDGQLSPWMRLKKYIEDNNLTITSLALYTDNNLNYSLPSIGKNPKFHQFESVVKPSKYNFYRVVGHDVQSTEEEKFAVIEAYYEYAVLQIWVRESNPENSWSLAKEVN